MGYGPKPRTEPHAPGASPAARLLFIIMSKKQKRNGKTSVPESVIAEMKKGGADFTAAQFMGRHIIKCTMGDRAATVYLEWIQNVSKNPDVEAIWAPTEGVIPPPAQVGPLLNEANWMIQHVSALGMNDFAGGAVPALGGPGMGFLGLPIAVHHASIAGNYLLNNLQNPPPLYVAINSLGTGTYICTLQYIWTEIVVVIQATKA